MEGGKNLIMSKTLMENKKIRKLFGLCDFPPWRLCPGRTCCGVDNRHSTKGTTPLILEVCLRHGWWASSSFYGLALLLGRAAEPILQSK